MLTLETRDNWEKWRSSLASNLSRHPDKLLKVLEEGEMTTQIKMREKSKYKNLNGDLEGWDEVEDELLHDFDTDGFYIVFDSMADNDKKREAKRLFGKKEEGQSLLAWIDRHWDATNANQEEQAESIKEDRDKLIKDGMKSGRRADAQAFVTKLQEFNDTLVGTPYNMEPEEVTLTVLGALSKHKAAMISAFRATKEANLADRRTTDPHAPGWKKDFHAVWMAVEGMLRREDKDEEKFNTPSEVLSTTTTDLTAVVASLTGMVSSLQQQMATLTHQHSQQLAIMNPNATSRDGPPMCDDCAFKHWPNREHGCIGKALATGKVDIATAAKVFKNAKDPQEAAKRAKERYLSAEENKKSTAGVTKPPRSVQFCTNTYSTSVLAGGDGDATPPTGHFAVKFDTQAEDSVFGSEA